MQPNSLSVLYGIDNLILNQNKYIPSNIKNLSLISNINAKTSNNTLNIYELINKCNFNITCIFSLEHGYFVNKREGVFVNDDIYNQTVPIFSLYTENELENVIIKHAAQYKFDAILFDIQDVGARFYTYIYALKLAFEAAYNLNIPLIICDRPNPISNLIIEGCLPNKNFISILCPFEIPIRYGLTLGELANYLSKYVYKSVNLIVIPMINYDFKMTFYDTNLKWFPPSPAMISNITPLFYIGNCLFEGTNLSEGRGTNFPFQIIGAPFINSKTIIKKINNYLSILNLNNEFNNILITPIKFKPTLSKFENIECFGIKLDFNENKPFVFKSLLFSLILLKAFYDEYNSEINFLFSTKSNKFFLDRLCGTSILRETIINKDIYKIYELYNNWNLQNQNYINNINNIKIY